MGSSPIGDIILFRFNMELSYINCKNLLEKHQDSYTILKIHSADSVLWTIKVIKPGQKYDYPDKVNESTLVEIFKDDGKIHQYMIEEVLGWEFVPLYIKIDIYSLLRIQRWLKELDDIELKIYGNLMFLVKSYESLAKETSLEKSEKISAAINLAKFTSNNYYQKLLYAFYEDLQ